MKKCLFQNACRDSIPPPASTAGSSVREHRGPSPEAEGDQTGCQDSGDIPASKCSRLKDISWKSFILIKKSHFFKKTSICINLQVLGPKGGAGEV